MLKKSINWLSNLITFMPGHNPGLWDEPTVTLKYVKLDPAAKLPTKSHTGPFEDAAFDLYATEDIILQSNERKMVNTHIAFVIPDGVWLKLRERSGLANKGIHLLGGVIDAGFSGSVQVILYNSDKELLSLPKNKAICQFTVEKLTKATVEELSFDSFRVEADKRKRGCAGFGSTDK